MRKLLYIFILLFFTSCGTQRLIKKHGKLGDKRGKIEQRLAVKGIELKKDIVFSVDTFIKTVKTRDTTIIWKPPIRIVDSVEVPCDENNLAQSDKKVISKDGIEVSGEVVNGVLKLTLKADSLKDMVIKLETENRKLVKEKAECNITAINAKDQGFNDGIKFISLIVLGILFIIGIIYGLRKL